MHFPLSIRSSVFTREQALTESLNADKVLITENTSDRWYVDLFDSRRLAGGSTEVI